MDVYASHTSGTEYCIFTITVKSRWGTKISVSNSTSFNVVMALNSGQKRDFAEHYDGTVKLTFDLLDIQSSFCLMRHLCENLVKIAV